MNGLFYIRFDEDHIIDVKRSKETDYNDDTMIHISIDKNRHIGDYVISRDTAKKLIFDLQNLVRLSIIDTIADKVK